MIKNKMKCIVKKEWQKIACKRIVTDKDLQFLEELKKNNCNFCKIMEKEEFFCKNCKKMYNIKIPHIDKIIF